ncbi:MAG: four helix bundle protein [Patescibacteria group bacterium]|nr:four helix bundle protein [Patescibacteria group bacterium]
MSLPKSLLDLRLVQETRKFIIIIYKITELLPDTEKYGLISQMRRAVVSVLANIVEGYGRKTKKDKLHFFIIARGSFREVECYILVLKDLDYISDKQYEYLVKVKDIVGGLLINFIKSKS